MLAINKCKNFYTLKLQLSTSRFTDSRRNKHHQYQNNHNTYYKAERAGGKHNVGYAFLLSRVMKEIITPINESIGPAIITSVYVYGA